MLGLENRKENEAISVIIAHTFIISIEISNRLVSINRYYCNHRNTSI